MSFALDVSLLADNAPDDSFDYSDAVSSKSHEAKGFSSSAHMDLMDLLEEWEEPELQGGVDDEVGAKECYVGRHLPFLNFVSSSESNDEYRLAVSSSVGVHKRRVPFLTSLWVCPNEV